MIVEVQVTIDGSRPAIWAAIADIANAADTISGIEEIEVLEKPATGLVGLKWRETRMLFGKPASVEKWITDAAENEFYKTRAESDGFIFLSTMAIAESNGCVTLTSSHDSRPQSIFAKLMSIPMSLLFKGVARKALLQDLNDIKASIEKTIYETAGGLEGLLRLAGAWHTRVLEDEVVSHAFSHGYHPQHTERLAAYWAEALGGPAAYSERYGDETSVVRMHSGNGPHEEMDQRAIACFDAALDDIGLARGQPLWQALHDYFTWATTTTMARYHRSAKEVPDGLRVPKWSWNGLVTDARP